VPTYCSDHLNSREEESADEAVEATTTEEEAKADT